MLMFKLQNKKYQHSSCSPNRIPYDAIRISGRRVYCLWEVSFGLVDKLVVNSMNLTEKQSRENRFSRRVIVKKPITEILVASTIEIETFERIRPRFLLASRGEGTGEGVGSFMNKLT